MIDLTVTPRDPTATLREGTDVDSPESSRSVTNCDSSRLDHLDDAELAAQALAATGGDMAHPDAVNYWDVVEPVRTGLLPDWYMPTPSAGARRLRGWRRRVVFLVVFSIGVINAAGLCITYGHVTLG